MAVASPLVIVPSTRTRPSRCLTSPHGFSLVEVLIATGLLATVIASLPHLFAVAVRANLDASDTTWAAALAAQKIEELRAEPFPELLVDRSVDYMDSGGRRLDDLGSAGRAYTRRWWIEPLSSPPGHTVVITVVVSRYRSGDEDALDAEVQRRETVRLVTLRTRKAP